MDEQQLKDISRRYFAVFSSRQLDALGHFFAAEASLRDWETEATGKDAVLAANRAIFDSVGSIEVEPVAVYADGRTVIAELEIVVDRGDPLRVVDVIEFDDRGKIRALRAYKG